MIDENDRRKVKLNETECIKTKKKDNAKKVRYINTKEERHVKIGQEK